MRTSDRHDLLRRRSFGICRLAKWGMPSEAKSSRVSPSFRSPLISRSMPAPRYCRIRSICWMPDMQTKFVAANGLRFEVRPADCGYPCQKPEASSARRETTLQREIAVKNVPLGSFDPARCRRNESEFALRGGNPRNGPANLLSGWLDGWEATRCYATIQCGWTIACAAGYRVELEIWPRMPHVWHLFAPVMPEARHA